MKLRGKIIIGTALCVTLVGGFLLGGGFGFQAGKDHAIQLIRDAVQATQYPTVYLSYPGKEAVALYRGGVCYPYPQHIPKYYHLKYVSPRLVPCASQKYQEPVQPSPALKAIEKETEK